MLGPECESGGSHHLACGYAGDAHAVLDVMEDDRTRSDERSGADANALDHDCADADMSAAANRDEPGEPGSGRYVGEISDPAIVLDDRARVHDGPVPDLGVDVHDRRREDLCACPEARAA
jgi:hypothetical protein